MGDERESVFKDDAHEGRTDKVADGLSQDKNLKETPPDKDSKSGGKNPH